MLVVVSCSCVASECRGRCFCQKEGLPCLDSCGCGGGDNCQNRSKIATPDDESDDETDSDDSDNEDEIAS